MVGNNNQPCDARLQILKFNFLACLLLSHKMQQDIVVFLKQKNWRLGHCLSTSSIALADRNLYQEEVYTNHSIYNELLKSLFSKEINAVMNVLERNILVTLNYSLWLPCEVYGKFVFLGFCLFFPCIFYFTIHQDSFFFFVLFVCCLSMNR